MANFADLDATTDITTLIQTMISDRLQSLMKLQSVAGDTNIIDGAIRFNDTSGKFEMYDLATTTFLPLEVHASNADVADFAVVANSNVGDTGLLDALEPTSYVRSDESDYFVGAELICTGGVPTSFSNTNNAGLAFDTGFGVIRFKAIHDVIFKSATGDVNLKTVTPAGADPSQSSVNFIANTSINLTAANITANTITIDSREIRASSGFAAATTVDATPQVEVDWVPNFVDNIPGLGVDAGGHFNNSTHVMKPTVKGWYQINACAFLKAASDQQNHSIHVVKNGAQNEDMHTFQCPRASVQSGFINMSRLIHMNGTTDELEIRVYRPLGDGNQELFLSKDGTFFSAYLVFKT